MLNKLIYTFGLLVPLTMARYAQIPPKFDGQDSAIIVDSDKQLPKLALNKKLQNALYYNYPVYELIKQKDAGRTSTTSSSSTTTTTTTSTTTAAPIVSAIVSDDADEFPSDLLYLAQHKLGLKNLDEIPSISELGQLLGTDNPKETIKYIRQLTETEQGIALMKAYIESADYTDSTDGSNDTASTDDDDFDQDTDNDEDSHESDDEDIDDDNNATDAKNVDADLVVVETDSPTSTTTTSPIIKSAGTGLLERFGNYMSSYHLWSSDSAVAPRRPTARPQQMHAYAPIFLPPPPGFVPNKAYKVPSAPLLVRQPLPYHYPIPLRPLLLPQRARPYTERTGMAPSSTTTTTTTTAPHVHLNTPKRNAINAQASSIRVAPHVQQLAQMANIEPQKLANFLQQKPKLAQLAMRVSSLPAVQRGKSTSSGLGGIDAKLFAAVQRAIESDEDLKKLLKSAEALK